MCRTIFAPGSHDLAIGEERCARAKQTGESCLSRYSVPMNNAARRADGAPLDPNEPDPGVVGAAAYDDYVFGQFVQHVTGTTDPAEQEKRLEWLAKNPPKPNEPPPNPFRDLFGKS